jgi:hypothetical protein
MAVGIDHFESKEVMLLLTTWPIKTRKKRMRQNKISLEKFLKSLTYFLLANALWMTDKIGSS